MEHPSAASTIGEMLRAKRAEKNLSIQKVRDDTKISTKYVLALEEGNFSIFPARVYLRGFFLLYAKYLGLENVLEIWQSFEKELPSEDFKDESYSKIPPKTEVLSSSRAVSVSLPERFWGNFVVWVTEGQNWILAFVFGPVLLLGILLGVYSYIRHRAYQISPASVLETESFLERASATKTRLPSVLTAQQGAKSASFGEITIDLTAKEEPSWISVELDSKKSFQGILSPNQGRKFRFTEFAKLRLGNPRTLSLFVNSKELVFSQQQLEKAPLDLELNAKNLKNP